MTERKIIEEAVTQVLAALARLETPHTDMGIPVGISNRHIHLSADHLAILFGSGYSLTKVKDLKQVGEFAAKETVTLIGPKGVLQGVRILGPVRGFTQVELSRTDGFILGIAPPVRDSGDIAGSAGAVIAGPQGTVTLEEGVICAARHIHMSQEDARRYALADGERVTIAAAGGRGGSLANVLVRIQPDFRLECHLDTDEANALGLTNGDLVRLRPRGGE
ncbi:phosphate propanoyltransferase [Acetonema longum]|uniref:Phosphate propanoyltransferase n=1 Tax=Acetonema longum DSM 6540 TaxID=1009370 RepID=F7NH17_9FIRM|nr:phosphate propanoyltransferase [Acetonema longum]EGO64748.1 propanediol utilization phosphotransacylase [Acetonema longum DSM 6540]